jgi:hypothetical protein
MRWSKLSFVCDKTKAKCNHKPDALDFLVYTYLKIYIKLYTQNLYVSSRISFDIIHMTTYWQTRHAVWTGAGHSLPWQIIKFLNITLMTKDTILQLSSSGSSVEIKFYRLHQNPCNNVSEPSSFMINEEKRQLWDTTETANFNPSGVLHLLLIKRLIDW